MRLIKAIGFGLLYLVYILVVKMPLGLIGGIFSLMEGCMRILKNIIGAIDSIIRGEIEYLDPNSPD